FRNARGYQTSILKHHADLPAQPAQLIVAHLAPVHQYSPGRRIVEPCNKANQGTFAGPARADQSHDLARPRRERNVAQRWSIGLVGEAHLFKLDRADELPRITRLGALLEQRFAVQQRVQASESSG